MYVEAQDLSPDIKKSWVPAQNKKRQKSLYFNTNPKPIPKPKVKMKKLITGDSSCAQHALFALDQITSSCPNMP